MGSIRILLGIIMGIIAFGPLWAPPDALAASLRAANSGMCKIGNTVRPCRPGDLLIVDAVEFTEDDTDPACASGNYNLYADFSETAIKACQDGVTAVIATGPGGGSGWIDDGTTIRLDTSTDEVVIGAATPVNSAKLSVAGDADQPQLVLKGNSTQTTNIMEVEDSAGTELFHLTNSGQLGISHVGTFADDHAMQVMADAAGFGDVKGLNMVYTTGALSTVEHADAILVNIDQSASTGGDVMAYEVLSTDSGLADVHGLNVGVGVSPIRQNSGAFGAVGFCEVETTGPVFADCVTAFNLSVTDVQIWVANGDRVNIGHATTFEEISWLWDTVTGNPGIQPTFEYSTGAGPTWAAFTPTDGTSGARNNGIMEWDATNLSGWVAASLDGDSAFWIRITRGCAPCTGPTEDLVETASPTTFSWSKDGKITVDDVLTATLSVTKSQSSDASIATITNASVAGRAHLRVVSDTAQGSILSHGSSHASAPDETWFHSAGNSSKLLLRQDGNKSIEFWTNGASRSSIDGAGNTFISNDNGLVVGHTTQITGNQLVEVQVLGTGSVDSSIMIGRWDNSGGSPQMEFIKSRNATIGSHAIVFDNDKIMRWRFLPDDGVDFATVAAEFQVEVDDATPEAGFIGTAFVWRQMPGGNGNSIVETMRISAAGDLILANDLADSEVSDTLTSSLFVGSGSTTTAIDLATAEAAGVLTVAKGGTEAGTFTDGGILLGSGTGAFTPLGVAANGEIPIGDGATDPVLATITGTANEIDVTNGAGSITLSLPTDISVVGITPGADFVITQNSVIPFTSVETGAIVNTMVLKDGKVGLRTNNAEAVLQINSPDDSVLPALFIRQDNADAGYKFQLDTLVNGDLTIEGWAGGVSTGDIITFSAGNMRVGVGTKFPDVLTHFEVADAATVTIVAANRLSHITSGTAATGFGVSQEFEIEAADGTNIVAGNISVEWAVATTGIEEADIVLGNAIAGAPATETIRFRSNNHIKTTGADPVLTSCGTTPTVVGSDMAGNITIGTGTITSCIVTFAVAYAVAPACTIAGDNVAVTYARTISTTVLTILSSADMATDVVSYICVEL